MDQVDAIMLALMGEADDAVRDVALEVTAALVEATPVDTGNLRASWVPNIGSPIDDVSTSREAVSDIEQQTGIAQIAGGYHIDMGAIHIVNGASYGQAVDARQPFVESAIETGVATAVAKGSVSR